METSLEVAQERSISEESNRQNRRKRSSRRRSSSSSSDSSPRLVRSHRRKVRYLPAPYDASISFVSPHPPAHLRPTALFPYSFHPLLDHQKSFIKLSIDSLQQQQSEWKTIGEEWKTKVEALKQRKKQLDKAARKLNQSIGQARELSKAVQHANWQQSFYPPQHQPPMNIPVSAPPVVSHSLFDDLQSKWASLRSSAPYHQEMQIPSTSHLGYPSYSSALHSSPSFSSQIPSQQSVDSLTSHINWLKEFEHKLAQSKRHSKPQDEEEKRPTTASASQQSVEVVEAANQQQKDKEILIRISLDRK
jgi:hypothetical protein